MEGAILLDSKRSAGSAPLAPGLKSGEQELDEVTPPLAGEHTAGAFVIRGDHVEEIGDPVVRGVVQVCRSGQFVRMLGERHDEVAHVVAVPTHLLKRMCHCAIAVLVDPHQRVAVLEALSAAPLLQFNDDV